VRELAGCLLVAGALKVRVWEIDPVTGDGEAEAEFAAVWSASPKDVFSRTPERVEDDVGVAEAPLAEEDAAVLRATDKDVETGAPAWLRRRCARPD